jgi:CheY-like chemotaxis protein
LSVRVDDVRSVSPRRGGALQQQRALSVLLVEDYDEVRALLAALLEASGCFQVVAEAATATEGIERLRSLEPDVVVVDYVLPDGTGAQVAQAARIVAPGTFVALVTALGGGAVGDALPDVDVFIDKAPTSASLVRQLLAALERAGNGRSQRH